MLGRYSPRERGCFDVDSFRVFRKVVFPAQAGVYRCRRLSPSGVRFLPRASGGVARSPLQATWRSAWCLVMTVSYRECGGSPFFFGPRVPPPVGRGGRAKDGICLPGLQNRASGRTMGFAYRPTRPRVISQVIAQAAKSRERWDLPTERWDLPVTLPRG